MEHCFTFYLVYKKLQLVIEFWGKINIKEVNFALLVIRRVELCYNHIDK